MITGVKQRPRGPMTGHYSMKTIQTSMLVISNYFTAISPVDSSYDLSDRLISLCLVAAEVYCFHSQDSSSLDKSFFDTDNLYYVSSIILLISYSYLSYTSVVGIGERNIVSRNAESRFTEATSLKPNYDDIRYLR